MRTDGISDVVQSQIRNSGWPSTHIEFVKEDVTAGVGGRKGMLFSKVNLRNFI